jgi:hypothetical protein
MQQVPREEMHSSVHEKEMCWTPPSIFCYSKSNLCHKIFWVGRAFALDIILQIGPRCDMFMNQELSP